MLKTKTQIEQWLNKNGVRFFIINDDLTVDVNGYVDISNNNLVEIPIQFGIVKGDFYCGSNRLTSLKGSPYEVTGSFHCAANRLTNLDCCPKIIKENLNCVQNPLISLRGFNSQLEGDFHHSSSCDNPFIILELESYYYRSSTPKGEIFSVWINGKEINSILSSLELENELTQNPEKKINKMKL